MPRTCSGPERAIIAGARVNHLLKLEVADADGVMRDCSALGTLALDLFDGVSWGETLDTPVVTGTLTIRRDTNDDSAAPTMGDSSINRDSLGAYAPLFEKGRAVRILAATVHGGAMPSSGDWKEMLPARIDTVHWQSNPMTIDISDIGAWVMDAFIQTAKQYGGTKTTAPGSGPLLGAVIQSMLDDVAIKGGSPTLYEPETAAWQPASDPQRPESVLTAARTFAQEIGWELRYRYDAAGVYRLTLYEPDRGKTTADWVIGPDEYRNVTNLETSIADIRNYIKATYTDAAGIPHTVTSQSAPSIAKYGLRFFDIGTSPLIRTEADLQALTDAILSDLSEAAADQDIEMPFFWPVQIGDLITFLANGDHYDTDQTLAVVGYTHTFANGEGSTTIRTRGRVAGAYRAWLRRQTNTPAAAVASLADFAWTDTDTTRVFTWTRKNAAAIWVYDYLVAAGSADPYTPSGLPTSVITSGADTYTAAKPDQRYQRFVHFVPRSADGVSGTVRNEVLDPTASALAGTIKTVVHNDTADLTLHIVGSQSNWPVTAELYEDNPDGSPIYSTTVSANTDITKDTAGASALGGRPLPLREVRRWLLKLIDVAGLTQWWPGSADRDALPNGSVTRTDYRALPELVITYDDDTDTIRITLPDGVRKKTISMIEGSGVATYTPGDLLDDLTTEDAFATDEQRGPYVVELQGGGVWKEFFRGPLHGASSKTPTAHPRSVTNTAHDHADAFVTVNTTVPELLRLYVRNSDSAGAPEYGLCAGAGDNSPRYVADGTELGPTDYFAIPGGAPLALLSAIALVRDQITRRYFIVEGKDSGVRGTASLALNTKGTPYLDSISATWNDATGNLVVTAKGGANCASALIEVDDNTAYASPYLFVGTLIDGGSLVHPFPLGGAERGKIWYSRVTPNNLSGGSGMDGTAVQDECYVPANFKYTAVPTQDPTAGTGTLTLAIVDSGLVIDQTVRVQFYVTVEGSRNLVAATSAPVSGTTGDFVWTGPVKLETKVEPFITFADGTTALLPAFSFVANTSVGTVAISITPIAGNISSQGTVKLLVDLPSNALSARYAIATGSAPTQPDDATTAASGTLVSGLGRTFPLTGPTVNLADSVIATVIPFTGLGGTGTQLAPIHGRDTFQTFAQGKTLRIAHTMFVSLNQSDTISHALSASAPTTKASFTLVAWIPLPKGATITAFRLNGIRTNGNGSLSATLYRMGGPTALQTLTHTGSGVQTVVGTVSETIGSNMYMVQVIIDTSSATNANDNQIVYVEFDYTSPGPNVNI